MQFLDQARPRRGSSVIDLGCGTGRAGISLLLADLNVTFADFADNCLDKEVREMIETHPDKLSFIEADLTKKLPLAAEYGFCSDVLEHIPPQDVDAVLNNCLMACKHVFFSIATEQDIYGDSIGHRLHLSQHPFEWWLAKFRERDCVIHWSAEEPGSCQFYLTAWAQGTDVVESGKLNTADEKVRENVKYNIAQGYQQVTPHETNETELMILGGGWTLPQFETEIRQKRDEGVKLITLNGTYNWCLEHGFKPSALLVVDARPVNAVFTRNIIDDCKYFIASQCDPSVFEGLPKDRTYIWHTNAELVGDLLNAQYSQWYPVPGGSTALLRSIPLFRMLGFKKFHLYGCDSCLSPEKAHHAYAQSWNDSEIALPVMVNPSGRVFYAHTWMISQAQEFMDLIKFIGDEVDIEIHGDGLLNHILQTGAELFELDTTTEET